LGLPLGSGMVESACKWLLQQRFKGVGMRWSEDGFNHLLHLRLAWVNGRFEALFGLTLSRSQQLRPDATRLRWTGYAAARCRDQRWSQDDSLPARSTLWAASAIDLGLVPPGEEGGGVAGHGSSE